MFNDTFLMFLTQHADADVCTSSKHTFNGNFYVPGGKWGPDCSKDCPCQNGGRCEPHTGKCLCPPGWKGLHCTHKCGDQFFGLECTQKCQCAVGQRCHHVSGECLPCTPGSYGPNCAKKCQCSSNGTALCLHTTGQCFCHPNW